MLTKAIIALDANSSANNSNSNNSNLDVIQTYYIANLFCNIPGGSSLVPRAGMVGRGRYWTNN